MKCSSLFIQSIVVLIIVVAGAFAATPVAAQSNTETLVADSMTTSSGTIGSGQSVSNIQVQDQSGSQDDWNNYVEFLSTSSAYQGYRSYTLPNTITPSAITSLQIQANYRGPEKTWQSWSWSLYNWSSQNWVTVGDNAGTPPWGDWYLLTFDMASAPSDFVEPTTREIRVQLQANNTQDNMNLDYEAIVVSYDSGGEPTTTVTYQPTTDLFANPERGFYRYCESKSSTSPLTIWSVSKLTSTDSVEWLSAAEEATITQIYCFFVLDDFLTTNINGPFIQNIRDNLANVRAAGKKCILRFAYSNDSTDADGDEIYDPDVFENGLADADLPQILAHIAQLDSVLDDYVDVISVLHAGFIGVWGEWYYTNHFIDDPANPGTISAAQYQRRRQIMDALLAALPAERMVALRYPVAKKEMYNRTTPITAAEAYQNTAVARIGYHNDAFLNAFGDNGTFQDPSDPAYMAAETIYLPMGGETNEPNESGVPSRDCSNAISEMGTYHWSYINTGYYTPTLTSWQTNSCIHNTNEISNSILDRLGYRLKLTQATLPNGADQGGTAQIQIDLVNDGFAAPYNPRDLFLIMQETNTGAEYSFPLTVDPRTWLANGQTHQILQTINMPATMPPGQYALYLHLPDPNATVAADTRYAIRLANGGIWPSTNWAQQGSVYRSQLARMRPRCNSWELGSDQGQR